jgi:hypothetical protein
VNRDGVNHHKLIECQKEIPHNCWQTNLGRVQLEEGEIEEVDDSQIALITIMLYVFVVLAGNFELARLDHGTALKQLNLLRFQLHSMILRVRSHCLVDRHYLLIIRGGNRLDQCRL